MNMRVAPGGGRGVSLVPCGRSQVLAPPALRTIRKCTYVVRPFPGRIPHGRESMPCMAPHRLVPRSPAQKTARAGIFPARAVGVGLSSAAT